MTYTWLSKIISKKQLELYIEEGKTNIWIANKYKVCPTTVSNWCKKYSLVNDRYDKTKKKFTLDESFFEAINTENKAYILGFLFADGYNSAHGRELKIDLHPQDRDILEKIKLNFNSDHPIKDRINNLKNKSLVYSVYSKRMCTDLTKAGCHNKKSKTLVFPDYLDSELIPHFIRGYFDGDGCIHIRKNNGYPIVEIVGTYSIVSEIQNKIGFAKSYISEITYSLGTYKVVFNCSNAKKFLDWIYTDATIYLDRKYKKYIDTVKLN